MLLLKHMASTNSVVKRQIIIKSKFRANSQITCGQYVINLQICSAHRRYTGIINKLLQKAFSLA